MGFSARERETSGGHGLPRLLLALLAAIIALLAVAPAAQATFHLIKVREVYAGTNNDSYVELQMYALGQSFLTGHSMTVYDGSGTLVHSSTFATGAAKSENQRTVLIGDSNVQATFGVIPDLVDSALSIPAAGGAACWNAGGLPADCVAWGNFNGAAALQTATGTSAGTPVSPAGITAGKAIRRTIAPGCATLLEESDDSDVSSADFTEVTPGPRNNASAIVEATCAGAPNTAIDDKPPPRANSAAAEFTYDSPTATSYECRLDAAAFAACPPNGGPQEYTGLGEGSHTFQVRGVNGSGPDPTPASYTWVVDTVAPTATIDTHPADPAPGANSSFSFHASESSSFECSLVAFGSPPAYSACTSAKTYAGLANGKYTFTVRPTDVATNVGAPASFDWQVDNSLADTTPPQTTIASSPPDPSPSSVATFTYTSSEAGSSFECSLDGSAFTACAATGLTYTGLANGSHVFQVRARDSSGNLDASPAGYSFSVAVAATSAPPASSAPSGPAASPPPSRAAVAPETVLNGKPAAKGRDRTPTFRFRSDLPKASFECSLDGGPYRACRSPFTTKALKPGRHTLAVRAAAAGVADSSPSKFTFKIVPGR
jgi:hypothetical protein